MTEETFGHGGLIHTSHENIPNYCAEPDTESVKDGNWFDPAIWSNGVPTADSDACIGHRVTIGQFVELEPDPDPDPDPEPGPPHKTMEVLLNGELIHAREVSLVFKDGVGRVVIDYDDPELFGAASPDVSAVCRNFCVKPTGKLSFAPAEHTRLSVGTLIVEGGLEVGTVAAPITGSAEIVFRDLPIDTQFDPQQLGHGLIILGDAKFETNGRKRTPFVRVATAPVAGNTTLTLAESPVGWLPGDRLWIADTRELNSDVYEQQERLTIAAVSGNVVTLDTSLLFDHPKDYFGDSLPHVAYLSSNITFRSENPNGTRGHVIVTGRADIRARDAVYADMGRTTFAQIDNTHLGPERQIKHVGTNQIGRYTFHMHHVYGPENPSGPTYEITGNVFLDGKKWGVAIHDTHFGLVKDNVIVGFRGAGLVFEDGSEFSNTIENNFVGLITGTGDIQGRVFPNNDFMDPVLVGDGTPTNPYRTMGDLGHEGAGIWARSVSHHFRGNVVANATIGWVFWSRFAQGDISLPETSGLLKGFRRPSVPGADPKVNWVVKQDAGQQLDHEARDNEVYGCLTGLDWRGVGAGDARGIPVTGFAAQGIKAWANYRSAIFSYCGDMRLTDGKLHAYSGSIASEITSGYLGLDNFSLASKEHGVHIATSGHIRNSHFQCWRSDVTMHAGQVALENNTTGRWVEINGEWKFVDGVDGQLKFVYL